MESNVTLYWLVLPIWSMRGEALYICIAKINGSMLCAVQAQHGEQCDAVLVRAAQVVHGHGRLREGGEHRRVRELGEGRVRALRCAFRHLFLDSTALVRLLYDFYEGRKWARTAFELFGEQCVSASAAMHLRQNICSTQQLFCHWQCASGKPIGDLKPDERRGHDLTCMTC